MENWYKKRIRQSSTVPICTWVSGRGRCVVIYCCTSCRGLTRLFVSPDSLPTMVPKPCRILRASLCSYLISSSDTLDNSVIKHSITLGGIPLYCTTVYCIGLVLINYLWESETIRRWVITLAGLEFVGLWSNTLLLPPQISLDISRYFQISSALCMTLASFKIFIRPLVYSSCLSWITI